MEGGRGTDPNVNVEVEAIGRQFGVGFRIDEQVIDPLVALIQTLNTRNTMCKWPIDHRRAHYYEIEAGFFSFDEIPCCWVCS